MPKTKTYIGVLYILKYVEVKFSVTLLLAKPDLQRVTKFYLSMSSVLVNICEKVRMIPFRVWSECFSENLKRSVVVVHRDNVAFENFLLVALIRLLIFYVERNEFSCPYTLYV